MIMKVEEDRWKHKKELIWFDFEEIGKRRDAGSAVEMVNIATTDLVISHFHWINYILDDKIH